MYLNACNPVKSEKPDRQIHRSETEETLSSSPQVYIPRTLALYPGHERIPSLCSELDGVRIHTDRRDPQGQVRLKIRNKPHVNESLPQGKEELPPVVSIGVGVSEKPPGGTAGQNMTLSKVQCLNHGTENLTAVETGKWTILCSRGTFLILLRHKQTGAAPGGSRGSRAPDVELVTSGERTPYRSAQAGHPRRRSGPPSRRDGRRSPGTPSKHRCSGSSDWHGYPGHPFGSKHTSSGFV